MMSQANIAMLESYAARGHAAGFVLVAVLLAVLLRGFSGNQLLYRALFGASGAFFALLALAGGLEYLYPHASTLHSTNLLTGFFGFAALATLWISGVFSQAARLVKSIGESAPAGTVRTSRSPLDPSVRGESMGPDAQAVFDPETSWTADAETVRLAPRGALGMKSAPAIDDLIATKCAERPAKIVLDFRNVTALDAAVVQTIVDCYRRYPASRFAFVATPDSAPHSKLTLLGIDQMIPIRPTLSAR